MRELTRSLKALANERRLRIIAVLRRRPESSVNEIAREVRLSVKSTSRHLQILASAEIVAARQDRLHVFYGLRLGGVLEKILPLIR